MCHPPDIPDPEPPHNPDLGGPAKVILVGEDLPLIFEGMTMPEIRAWRCEVRFLHRPPGKKRARRFVARLRVDRIRLDK